MEWYKDLGQDGKFRFGNWLESTKMSQIGQSDTMEYMEKVGQ